MRQKCCYTMLLYGDFVFYRWAAAFTGLSVNINFYLHKEA